MKPHRNPKISRGLRRRLRECWLRREDKEQGVDVRLGEVRETFFEVTEAPSAGERAKHIREGMLRGTTDPITASVAK